MKLPRMTTLSEIVTVLTAIIGVAYYIFHLDSRLSNLEIKVSELANKQQYEGVTNTDIKEKNVLVPERKKIESYTDNHDGTITDKVREFMWKKCSEGQRFDVKRNTCTRLAKVYTWKEANTLFSKNNTFAGYSDWRLPDNRELQTLIWCSNGTPSNNAAWGCDGKKNDKGEYQSPTIDLKFFPNTEEGAYISSTITSYEGKKRFWIRWFNSGGMFGSSDKSIRGSVRLVRLINP